MLAARVWNCRTHTYHWILASGWVGDLIKSKLIVTRHNNFVITAGHSFTPGGTSEKFRLVLLAASPEIKTQQSNPERSTLGKAQPKGFYRDHEPRGWRQASLLLKALAQS